MARAESSFITRRALVAGAAALVAAEPAAALPVARLERSESRDSLPLAKPAPGFADAQPGLRPRRRAQADPIHAAIAKHARAYAAYDAQCRHDWDDAVMWRLCRVERRASDKLAATVPSTLEGAAAALAYVRLLHDRDDYPLFDDYYLRVHRLGRNGGTAGARKLGLSARQAVVCDPGCRFAQAGLRSPLIPSPPPAVPPRHPPPRAGRRLVRHEIQARRPPRMAAQEPRENHPRSRPQAESLQRLVGVIGAGGQVAAVETDDCREGVSITPH
jgi:hypothetical protein